MTKQSFLDQAVLAMLSNPVCLEKATEPEHFWAKAETIWKARPATIREASKGKFVKPTLLEVQGYMREKGYANFTAQKWLNFYESKGWKIGKNPMKDWKAAVRTWGEKDSGTGSKPLGFV